VSTSGALTRLCSYLLRRMKKERNMMTISNYEDDDNYDDDYDYNDDGYVLI